MIKSMNILASVSVLALLMANAQAAPTLDDWHMIDRDSRVSANAMPAMHFEPLILNENGVKSASPVFMNNVHVNNIANEYMYNTVKGDVMLADKSMTELEKMGWTRVGHFSALEGKYLNFGDMHAGIVIYNAAQNMYNVVWHGTAGAIKKENGPSTWAGWETNLDNDLMEARQVKSEIIRTIKAEVNSILRAQKSGLSFFNFKQTRTINAFMKVLNESMNTTWSADKLEEFSSVFVNTLKAGLPKANSKKSSPNAISFVENIEAAFKVKTATLKDIEKSGFTVDHEGKTHRGFTLKVASAMPQIAEIMKRHAASLSEDQRKTVRVMNSGHSMAAGLTKIFAASLQKHFKTIFGSNVNASDNRILVHAMSSPLVGDATFKHDIEKNVGANNIYDQIVQGDFVKTNKPLTYIPDVIRSGIEKLPMIGPQLVTQCDSEYVNNIGTPAIDTALEVYGRKTQSFPEIANGFMDKPIYSHYGINTGDGRGAHFDSRLTLPMNGKDGFDSQLARGQESLKGY